MKQDVERLQNEMQQMSADLMHDESVQVAFSVVSHAGVFGPVEEDTNIPYEITYTNTGSCWNSEANVFQALVAGVYQFTASMRSNTDSYADCHIVHTPASTGQLTRVATMFGDSSSDGVNPGGDANSVIIELALGDEVSVQLEGYGRIYSSASRAYSTFSGFLLFQ